MLVATTGLAVADDGKEGQDKAKEHRDGEAKDGEHHSEFAHEGNKWILRNDKVAVWFHQSHSGKAKPDVRVRLNGTDDEKSGYRVEVLRLCEVDANSSACDHALPSINLARAEDWNVVTERGNGTLTITMVRSEAQGIVTLIWHIDTVSAAVKFDVKVDNWRWANNADRLLLDTHVVGKNLKNATGAQVNVEDSGYIQWATSAAVTNASGNVTDQPVHAFLQNDEAKDRDHEGDDDDHERSERESGKGGHLLLVFENSGGAKALVYDPTLGVASVGTRGIAGVPAIGFVAGVAVLGTAALVLRRRT